MVDDFAQVKRAYDAANPKEPSPIPRWFRQWRCFWTRPFGHRWNGGGLSAECVACGKEWVGNL